MKHKELRIIHSVPQSHQRMIVINKASRIEFPIYQPDVTERLLQTETRNSDSNLNEATKLNLSDLADVHMDVLCRLQTLFQMNNNQDSKWVSQSFYFHS